MNRTAFVAGGLLAVMPIAFGQGIDVKLFDRLEYRAIGPVNMGGRATDVEGVPGDPNLVYAGTGGGGFFKSTNGGVTWTSLWEREGSFSVGDFALDPRNPEVIWLGSGEANMRNSVSFGDGVYKSMDGGRSWAHLGLKETEHIARLLVSPLDSSTAWVCAVGRQAGPSAERGVFMTTDGGRSWSKTLFIDSGHGCADLEYEAGNPNVLYAAMWRFERKPWTHTSGSEQSGVFKSVDGGRTWKKLEKGLPKLLGRAGVKVAPSNSKIVYVACESKEGTLYRSDDAGETFKEMTRERDVVSRGFYYADIRVDPQDENRVYAIATALQVSIDAGKTWKRIGGRIHSDHHSLWIDSSNPSRIWNANDGGLAVSYDRGDNWEVVNNIPLGQFYQIHADNRVPFYNVTGGLQDNGTWTGPSRVRQNSGISTSEWSIVSFGDGFFVYSHPDNPDLFLTESQGGSIYRSDYASGEQQSVSPQPRSGRVGDLKYRFNWNAPIVGSHHAKNTVYLGGSVLFQTRDFGGSWEPISPDLTKNDRQKMQSAGGPVWFDNSTAENHGTIISVSESPVKPGIVWIGTDDGNLQSTTDSGRTWTNHSGRFAGVAADSPVSHVEASRASESAAYVAFDRHLLDDYKPHIYKTTDGGKTWTRCVSGLPENAYVHVVREDPVAPRLLYAGTELGLFISFDSGANWQPFLLKNLPKVAVHDIVIHPREHDLILGTHGRSIQILDDTSFLREFTPELAAKRAHLFAGRHAWRHSTPMRTYGGGNKGYSGPNPPYGALLTYYLKNKMDEKETLKLEILDSSGALVRSIEKPPREAGLHRVSWDLRYEAPKGRRPPTPEESDFGGGLRGPMALPAVYTARLTVGSEQLETKIQVRLDPALKTGEQDLAAQRDLGLRLRPMVNEVNTALKSLDSLADQFKQIESLGELHGAERLKEWVTALAGYRKELEAVTAAIGIKRAGNRLEDAPRLAEDLAGLYGQVTSGHSAPTQAQQLYSAELEKRFNEEMAPARKLLSETVPGWSDALRRMGAPGLVAGPPTR